MTFALDSRSFVDDGWARRRVHGEHFETLDQAKYEALDWLLCYNHTHTLHSRLNYVSPTQFEQAWNRCTAAIAS